MHLHGINTVMMKYFLPVIVAAALLTATLTRNSLWNNDLTLWTDVLKKNTAEFRAWHELGVYYLEHQEYEKALTMLQTSLSIDRYQLRIFNSMAMSYEGLGRLDMAVKMYEAAMFSDTNDPAPYYNLGILYYRKLQDRDKAFELFRRAIEVDPYDPKPHFYLSLIYQERGDAREAAREKQRYNNLQ